VSSTSTNKQPLLIDSPYHEFAILGPTAALTASGNLMSLQPSGLQPLLLSGNHTDGALIESISLIANEASMTAARVLIFLSKASTALAATPENTVVVASGAIGSSTLGERTDVALPPILTPVPSTGAAAAPTATAKKNTGLRIAPGYSLYCGLTTPLLLPSPAALVTVLAQGGLY